MDEYEIGKQAGFDEALKAIQEAASQIEPPRELDGMVHQTKIFNACITAINERRALIEG